MSGNRSTKPSSPQRVSTSAPPAARMRAADSHGPRNVNAAAERCEDADAPVAEFVAAAFDDDGAIVGNLAGGGFLVVEKLEEVFGCVRIEIVFRDEACEGGRFWHGSQFTDKSADATAEFERAARAIALPEWHFAGFARGGFNEDAIMRDVDDAPGRCAQDERFVGMRLEDHLFVEFAHSNGFAFGLWARKTP